MNVIPFAWVFRPKPLDVTGKKVLHNVRCCMRGDYQLADIEYDLFARHAPVATHENIQIVLAFAASRHLIVKGGYMSNAYLNGDIDCPVYIEQPTDSIGKEVWPGYIGQLNKTMYGLKQVGRIRGSLLVDTLHK